MSKFKIEHGASKINLVLLKTNVEDTISQDIDLLANWSNNERRFVINELLRFAVAQEEDFQKYKASLSANGAWPASSPKASVTQAKSVPEPAAKPDTTATIHA